MHPHQTLPKDAAALREKGYANAEEVNIAFPAATKGYNIYVGANLLAEAGALIEEACGIRRCIVVTDSNVSKLYLQRLEAVLTAKGHTVLPAVIVEPGEASKTAMILQTVLGAFFERKADRKTLIIALGGGVVGDLAGFAASIFMRGIDVVQIPTTLLAQVDSSVGGKTGIDTAYGKNTVGTFYQPKLVLIDVTVLDSLPQREMLAGYAELVKYGLIMDAPFFEWCRAHGIKLLNGDREAQIHAIGKSCAFKAQVVEEDEREGGRRAILNMGHTFGHALEASLGFSGRLLHGEGVAIGTIMAFRLSSDLGLCPSWDANAVEEHFKAVGLPAKAPEGSYDVDRLMELMGQDKKAEAGRLTLILAKGIGKAFVEHDVNPYPIRALWRSAIES